jgi:hypothetical protein
MTQGLANVSILHARHHAESVLVRIPDTPRTSRSGSEVPKADIEADVGYD